MDQSLPQYAIIVAGGSGSRMQTSIPKQFVPINGMPILMHTIRQFRNYSPHIHIILVLPEQHVTTWNTLCQDYLFDIPTTLVMGGSTRFHSVRNGLNSICESEGLVAIHDGVRPFVSIDTIRQSFAVAHSAGCAVAAVPLKDSIRRVDAQGNNQALDRTHYWLVQTPQTFRLSLIKHSFLTEYQTHFTDDASVAEQAGFPISLIEGSYQNIKITTADDLIWAEAWIGRMNK